MVYQINKNGEITSVIKGFTGFMSFNTWEEAHTFMLEKVNEKIEDAECAFTEACKERALIEGMKP